MKILYLILLLCCFSIPLVKAQEENQKQLDFSLLRQNDVITIPVEIKNGFYDNLKQIDLGNQ
ncbi:MAG: hypothetical protein AAGH81_19470, partial [Bacteroidota bacterium]